MAIKVLGVGAIYALVDSFNKQRRALVASQFHADITQRNGSNDPKAPVATSDTITAANATTLGTSITLAAQLVATFQRHYLDPYAHNTAVSTAGAATLAALAPVVDLATVILALNACKSTYETHRASATIHFNADSTNTIAAANASDQGTSNTLANELKTDFNAHIVSAVGGGYQIQVL